MQCVCLENSKMDTHKWYIPQLIDIHLVRYLISKGAKINIGIGSSSCYCYWRCIDCCEDGIRSSEFIEFGESERNSERGSAVRVWFELLLVRVLHGDRAALLNVDA